MDTYLVGGAVRDALLGLPVVDRDYVVVGALPEQLLTLGYQQVGNDFPVFLHPKSKDEYALARTERKAGSGYTGFICDFGPDITLEEDLSRRDITINAIAQDAAGTLYDPYGGQADLADRCLRHVSDAFSEDPLRVLRVARFAARFHHLGFRVADKTLSLMGQIADSGELSALTPERVWKETEKALACEQPQMFFEVLRSCDALAALFPELEALFTVDDANLGPHALQALKRSAELTTDLACRFAAVTLQLDEVLITALCKRNKVPTEHKELAILSSRWHQRIHQLSAPTLAQAANILALFQETDSWRRPERFAQLLLCVQADWHASTLLDSNTDSEPALYPQRAQLWHWFNELTAITAGPFIAQGLKGPAIGDAIKQARLAQLQEWLKD